jgi:hypothetical protein
MSQTFNMENPLVARNQRAKRSALADISNNANKATTQPDATKVDKKDSRRRSSVRFMFYCYFS